METENKKGNGKRKNGNHAEQYKRKAVKRYEKKAIRRHEKEYCKAIMRGVAVFE